MCLHRGSVARCPEGLTISKPPPLIIASSGLVWNVVPETPHVITWAFSQRQTAFIRGKKPIELTPKRSRQARTENFGLRIFPHQDTNITTLHISAQAFVVPPPLKATPESGPSNPLEVDWSHKNQCKYSTVPALSGPTFGSTGDLPRPGTGTGSVAAALPYPSPKMPAIMDDPEAPTIYRVVGEPPYPDPANPTLPETILPRQVTLRDRQTVATVVPFAHRSEVPPSLMLYLSDQFKKEVEGGDTYPMIDPLPFERFASYWFQNFGAVMLLGSISSPAEVTANDDRDWAKICLGSFYIKPNYPGRSSHVCNAGFFVTDAARNRGAGRLMGEAYLDWAPKLGYTYSVFNLVYETNVASCKIWDALGFKRIGRVKGCGNLKSHPGKLIDAIIYGRDLVVGEAEELLVSEERFDKIRYYLKYGKYPHGADRAEKSRLRSAATHYKLEMVGDGEGGDGEGGGGGSGEERLMLKGKEVISDPARQYAIAREVHVLQHGGINKTTATIAEKYHWSRIKETVSDVIRACAECKELGKTPFPGGGNGGGMAGLGGNAVNKGSAAMTRLGSSSSSASPSLGASSRGVSAAGRRVPVHETPHQHSASTLDAPRHQHPQTLPLSPFNIPQGDFRDADDPMSIENMTDMTVMSPGQTLHTATSSEVGSHHHNPMLQDQPHSLHHHHGHHHLHHHSGPSSPSIPLPLPLTQDHQDHHQHVYQPIDPQIISSSSTHHHQLDSQIHDPFVPYHHPQHDGSGVDGIDIDTDPDTFRLLLNETDDGDGRIQQSSGPGHGGDRPPDSHPKPIDGQQQQGVDERQEAARETEREEARRLRDREAMDRDLDMMVIEPPDEDDGGQHGGASREKGADDGGGGEVRKDGSPGKG